MESPQEFLMKYGICSDTTMGIEGDKKLTELLEEYANLALRVHDVVGRSYQIDFGNHLRCKLKITDGKIEVEGAINGWGEGVPLDEVVILKLND